jgi:hypothetical protein
MAFYYPTDPYEQECDTDCYTCFSIKKDLDTAGDNLVELIKHLYHPGKFDNEEFEDNLRDLCKRLEVNFPKKELQITRK